MFFAKRRPPQSILGYMIFSGIFLGVFIGLLWDHPSPSGREKAVIDLDTPDPFTTPSVAFWVIPTRSITQPRSTEKSWQAAKVGTAAPDFSLPDRSGIPVRLSDLHGKVVIITFWASWCPACRDEMPDLQSIAEDNKDRDLVVLGVNTTYVDVKEDALAFVDEMDLTFPIVFDETGEVGERLYTIYGLPTSYWIDRDGIIRWIKIGAATRDQMVENVEILLLP